MNDEQLKFVADILKIIAVGQFGYFGYNGVEHNNYLALVLSGGMFIYLIVGAIMTLGKMEGKK